MVRQHIHAAGLIPDELEKAITAALVDEQVMVNPIVMVTVVENHSQAITVVGAVKNPTTFQAGGAVTLLEAIIRAGGISDVAGSDILVSHQTPSSNGSIAMTERIPVRSLMDPSDPASSLLLEGGEIIRVPLGGRIFIVGNVKHPGPLQIAEGSDNTVLKDITLAGGLDSFTSHTAYIYRVEAGTGRNDRIPIQIKKIMTFKAPDVPLYANDMVYVPNATGQRLSAKALEWSLGIGLGIAGILIYLVH
jgi:polysaccharide export outer membrane protein